MHVLILNQTFFPDMAATAQHMWDLARHLVAHGHRVSAVTSRSIYGTDQQHPLAYESIDGIDIHRVAGTAFGKKHLAGRMSDFLSFYLAAFVKLQRLHQPDVILALTSPPMIAAMGVLQRQFRSAADGRKIRLAYHVMDLYPDAAIAMQVMRQGSFVNRVMTRVTRQTLNRSDAVIVLGRDMRQRIIEQYDFARHSDRIHIVPPWADGADLKAIDKSENPLARELSVVDSFNIVYSGNFGMAHDVETITSAIETMRHDANTRWLFIGGGNRFGQLKAEAERRGWTHVQFHPYMERQRLPLSLSLADVHLVSQLPQFTGIVVPSKLYGILAVARPSVMVGPPDAECSLTIREHDCGFVVPNGNTDELVSRLRQLRDDHTFRQTMGQRARAAFDANYDKTIACGRIEQILLNAIAA